MPQPVQANLFCPKCGYDLQGQVIERCPECGFHYDKPALRHILWNSYVLALDAYDCAIPPLVIGFALIFVGIQLESAFGFPRRMPLSPLLIFLTPPAWEALRTWVHIRSLRPFGENGWLSEILEPGKWVLLILVFWLFYLWMIADRGVFLIITAGVIGLGVNWTWRGLVRQSREGVVDRFCSPQPDRRDTLKRARTVVVTLTAIDLLGFLYLLAT